LRLPVLAVAEDRETQNRRFFILEAVNVFVTVTDGRGLRGESAKRELCAQKTQREKNRDL